MRLTRHAKNRLRWIRRVEEAVTEAGVLEAILQGRTLGYDAGGNRIISITVEGIELHVVIDEAARTLITIWRR